MELLKNKIKKEQLNNSNHRITGWSMLEETLKII